MGVPNPFSATSSLEQGDLKDAVTHGLLLFEDRLVKGRAGLKRAWRGRKAAQAAMSSTAGPPQRKAPFWLASQKGTKNQCRGSVF